MPSILVGTSDGLHVLNGRAEPVFTGRRVTALATGRGRLWAVVDAQEVWTRPEGGRWEKAAAGGKHELTCLVETRTGVLAGAAEAHLYRLNDGLLSLEAAFDHVQGREHWFTPWGGPPDTRSLSVDAADALYANVHVGGIAASHDDGVSWAPTELDIRSDVHQVVAHPHRAGVLLAATARGLALSRDAGSTWDIDASGLHATYARAVAIAGDNVLLTVSRGPGGGAAAIYRRPLEDEGELARCRAGLPDAFAGNIDTHALAALGNTVVFGTRQGAIYASDDAGGAWRTLAEGLPPVECLLLTD